MRESKAVHRHKSVELIEREAEKAHRQKSVELENIRITMGGELNLKLFAYPIKKQAYPGKLAFVVYYEYETKYGKFTNFDKRSEKLIRFWMDENHNLNDVLRSGELALTLRSISYREIRFAIIKEAIFNSVNQKPLTSSANNAAWFDKNIDAFKKREVRSVNFTSNRKSLNSNQNVFKTIPTLAPEKIEETPFIEITEIKETIDAMQNEDLTNKTSNSTKVKKLVVKIPANLKVKSSGLAKFVKKHAA